MDADNGYIKSTVTGKVATRDIVQFVEYRALKNDPSKLAAETLREIPQQFLDFMRSKKFKPNNKKPFHGIKRENTAKSLNLSLRYHKKKPVVGREDGILYLMQQRDKITKELRTLGFEALKVN